jgi:membrane fusion protein (multidrug efflux system)
MSLPEYREGDQVEPGRTVGPVIDPKAMELVAKVGELERSNIKEGQTVEIELDALPGSVFHGTVKTVGGNNARRFWDDDSSSKFEVSITLGTTDVRMRPGLTARVSIEGDPRKNVIFAPRQALFLKDNKRVVYVRQGNNFEAREVKIQAQNESRDAIDGVSAGTVIALVDPTIPRKTGTSGSQSTGGGAP